MKTYLRLFIITFFGFLSAEGKGWNSTTFEYLWNRYAFNTKFREPIDVTPFEIKFAQLSYIGPDTKVDYFLPLPWMDITDSDSSSISTKNKNIQSIPGLSNYRNRTLNSIEIDFYKYNYFLKYFQQNVVDIQTGLAYNRIEAINSIELPPNLPDSTGWLATPEEVSGLFEYHPIIETIAIKNSLTWKPTHYFQFTAGTFLGYSFGTVYKSSGGDRYLWGEGNRWNVSLSSALVIENKDKNFNYIFGGGFESGGAKLSKINDNKYGISPISGLNIYTYGWNFSVGVQYGGRRTSGDKGFRRIIEDDYIGAIERLGQFVRFNPSHPQINDAKELILKCEQQLSYQTYNKGMNALEDNDLEGTGYWLKQALETEDENIKTLAKFQLDKIARTIIDSVKNNINTISLTDAEKLVLKAKSYSDEFSVEADIIRGKIYLEQGDILLKNGHYSRSLNKYQEAVQMSSDLTYIVNEKEKTLAKAFLSDASKGFEKGDLIFIIESLKQSRKLSPKTDAEYDDLLVILEDLKE